MYNAPPGVFDIVPNDEKEKWRSSYIWNYVENIIRETAKLFGYEEIRTPVFEKTELFTRSVGETTDIVSKEMYTFEDKGGRSLTLRPEGTAAAIRAILENHLHEKMKTLKVFYIASMFRYERAQAGRYRQHHQFGVEAIGREEPEMDAETIFLAYSIYKKLGINNLSVYLNSIGDADCRMNYKSAFKNYLTPFYSQLSADSQKRLETNPLRILDSKDPKDIEICKNAPKITDFLNEADKSHFMRVQTLLTALEIPYTINNNLVRGLDYYNKTVFEIVSGQLGSQNSVCGGGRYDGLVRNLGGPDLPAIGFGSGIERIIQTMLKQEVDIPLSPKPQVHFIALGEKAKEEGFLLTQSLREHEIAASMDYSDRKLGKMLNEANTLGIRYTVVIGDHEIEKGTVILKDMHSGSQQEISQEKLLDMFKTTRTHPITDK